MLHNNQEAFLSELSRMFECGRQSGKTVRICMKRYDGRTSRNPRKPGDRPKRDSKQRAAVCQAGDLAPAEYKCLVRASLDQRKVSFVVGQRELAKFQQSYSSLIIGNIHKLSKRPRGQSSAIGANLSAAPKSTGAAPASDKSRKTVKVRTK